MQVFNKLKTRIINYALPKIDSDRQGIRYWQDRLLFILLTIGVSFGFLVYIPSVILSIVEGLWIVAIVDTFIYFWVVFLFIKRSLPFNFRAYSFIILSYVLAIILLLTIGPFGAGPVWLFFFPIITSLLLNARAATISLLINAATIIVLGFILYYDTYGWRRSAGFPLESWAIIGVNFLLLNIMSTWVSVSVLNGLQNSLSQEQAALASVEHKNKELHESNIRLQSVINDRNRFEQDLEASELKFQDLVNMLPLSYFLVDTDLNLKYMNIKTLETFMYNNQADSKALPKTATELLIPVDRAKASTAFAKLMQTQTNQWVQYTGLTADGQEIPIELLASVININQKIAGVQCIVLNISERLEHEKNRKEKEIAEQTNKAISEWIAFIVHELKTPMNGLLQFADLGINMLKTRSSGQLTSDFVRANPNLNQASSEDKQNTIKNFETLQNQLEYRDGKFTKYFNTIYNSGSRLLRLSDELLVLSKLESSKMEFNIIRSDLLKIINEACEEVAAITESKQITLEIDKTNDSVEVYCDPFRIGQVMRNLLSNAIKFSNPESKISIKLTETQLDLKEESYPAMKTTIHDQGIGIPVDQLDFVFEKFRQSRKSRVGEGAGLGLPICKHIINSHKGEIWAESKENQGTQIHFVLPFENQSEG